MERAVLSQVVIAWFRCLLLGRNVDTVLPSFQLLKGTHSMKSPHFQTLEVKYLVDTCPYPTIVLGGIQFPKPPGRWVPFYTLD